MSRIDIFKESVKQKDLRFYFQAVKIKSAPEAAIPDSLQVWILHMELWCTDIKKEYCTFSRLLRQINDWCSWFLLSYEFN